MIAIMGFMIGAYIITKMVSLLLQPEGKNEHPITMTLAVLTLLVTGACLVYFWTGGGQTTQIPGL